MSQFEYLGIAFGLLYSVSALRLIRAIPYALRPGRRDWLHSGYLGAMLIGIAVNFWKFGALRAVDWTLPRYLLALLLPVSLYLTASTLVPDDPDEVTSWRHHFASMRRPFFFALVLAGATMMGHAVVLLGEPPQATHLALVSVGAIGAATGDRRVLAGLFALIATFLAADVIRPGENPWL
jgi:hypothetical protein